jgi:hypothetical protein
MGLKSCRTGGFYKLTQEVKTECQGVPITYPVGTVLCCEGSVVERNFTEPRYFTDEDGDRQVAYEELPGTLMYDFETVPDRYFLRVGPGVLAIAGETDVRSAKRLVAVGS